MNYIQGFQEITSYFEDKPEAPKGLIVGKERVGKTELLLKLQEHYLGLGHDVAFLDGQLMMGTVEGGLLALANKLEIDDMPKDMPDYLMSSVLEGRICKRRYSSEKQLIILLDEYLCVNRWFLAFLRAICIDDNIGMIVVECTDHEPIEEWDMHSSPLENILYPVIELDGDPIR